MSDDILIEAGQHYVWRLETPSVCELIEVLDVFPPNSDGEVFILTKSIMRHPDFMGPLDGRQNPPAPVPENIFRESARLVL